MEIGEKLTAAVLSYNTASKLEVCLRSLETHLPRCSVIVWDNASRDGSPEMVRERFPRVRLVASRDNLLFAEGCNQLVHRCGTELVLLMNADVFLQDGSLREIADFMASNRDLVAVSPAVEDGGRLRHLAHGAMTPSLALARDTVIGKVLRRTKWYRRAMLDDVPAETIFRAPKITNCCCVLRRESFLAMGGFDAQQLLYWTEEDFALRAAEAGHEQAVYGKSRVRHEHGSSTATLPRALLRAIVVRDRVSYMRRHFGPTAAALVELAVFLRPKLWRSAYDWYAFLRHRREMVQMARVARRGRDARPFLSAETP